MRVLAVTDVTGRQVGGVAAAAAELLAGLADRGMAVGLVNDVPYPGTERVQHFPAADVAAGAFREGFSRIVDAWRPDIVHLVSMGQRGIANLLPVLGRLPWLLTVHSLSPQERILRALHGSERLHYLVRSLRYGPNTLGWRALFRRRIVPHVVVHSDWMLRTLVEYGHSASSSTVIPLASSETGSVAAGSGARAAGASPWLVTVAGYAHTKGIHDAIRALHSLKRTFPDIRYSVAGELRDRSYRAYLGELTRRLGLREVVEFRERLPRPERAAWMRDADVYVQPSHEEGFCLAYLEAARLSGRLVGTNTGAMRMIGEGDADMRTVPVRDPASIATAVTESLARPAPSRADLERRRRRLDHTFSPARYVDDHAALYARMVGQF